ncbi:MAG: hypothetical protein EOO41_00505 [Methanobacteriota archaeon]|nr:MAG: hypothetical protein EOO41_00505 [Euryarchaeota archaeon]
MSAGAVGVTGVKRGRDEAAAGKLPPPGAHAQTQQHANLVSSNGSSFRAPAQADEDVHGVSDAPAPLSGVSGLVTEAVAQLSRLELHPHSHPVATSSRELCTSTCAKVQRHLARFLTTYAPLVADATEHGEGVECSWVVEFMEDTIANLVRTMLTRWEEVQQAGKCTHVKRALAPCETWVTQLRITARMLHSHNVAPRCRTRPARARRGGAKLRSRVHAAASAITRRLCAAADFAGPCGAGGGCRYRRLH